MAQRPQPTSAHQRHTRRRSRRRAVRRRTSVTLLVVCITWGIVALTRYATQWIHLAFLGAVLLLLTILYLARPRPAVRTGPSGQTHLRPHISLTPDPAPGRPIPKAVSLEYNTLTDFPRRKTAPHPAGPASRTMPQAEPKPSGSSGAPSTQAPPPAQTAATVPKTSPAPTASPVQPAPPEQPSPAGRASSPAQPASPAQTAPPAEPSAPAPSATAQAASPAAPAPSTPDAAAVPPDPQAEPASPQPASPPEPASTPPAAAEPTYRLPTPDMLPTSQTEGPKADDLVLGRAALLEEALRRFGAEAKVADFLCRPDVTRFEVEPGPGIGPALLATMADELALALAATEVRVHPSLPGKTGVTLEVPNQLLTGVPLRTVVESPAFQDHPSPLAIALGQSPAGEPLVADLAALPHLLVEGDGDTAGCLRALICSLLMKARPDQVRLLLIDPGGTVLTPFSSLPHLAAPTVTGAAEAVDHLRKIARELESHSPAPTEAGAPRPATVIVITDLEKVVTAAPTDAEEALCRLAAMAGTCHVHLVAAVSSALSPAITPALLTCFPACVTLAKTLPGACALRYQPGGKAEPVLVGGALIDGAAARALAQFCCTQAVAAGAT